MLQTFILTFLELLWFPNPPVDKVFYQATYFGKIRSLLRPHQTSGSSTQNLHWKLEQQTTYAGTLLVDLETTYFLGIKLFLFFKIESWNFFSICLKMNFVKPHKVSTHSANSDNGYLHFFFSWMSDWVEILWGFTKFIFKLILKISAFYLKKALFLKKDMI